MTSSPTYPQSNGKVEAAVKSAKVLMKKSRKAKTDPYLALLEYRNTPSQGTDSSPVVRLMSRRTRSQVPSLPPFLKPVIDHSVHDKLLTNKKRQASYCNKGAKDLTELRSGDTVRLIPPRGVTNEAVKARVDKPVGTRSYEVITEDGARYRRNRRHLRKTRESYESGTTTRNSNQQISNQTASPSMQTERTAVAPALSEQTEARRDPVILQRKPESSSQPAALSGLSSQ